MKRTFRHVLVLVTAPDLKTARTLTQAALTAKLAAGANLLPRLESHYWWRGKLERRAEVLMLLKTTRTQLKALEKLILAEHPYDTAEFVVLSLEAGTAKYLAWIDCCVLK